MNKMFRSLILGVALLGITAGGITVAQEKGKTQPKDAKKAEGAAKDESKIEIYQEDGKNKKFRFRVYGKDGTLLAMATKGYDTKDDVTKVVKALQEIAAKAPITEAK